MSVVGNMMYFLCTDLEAIKERPMTSFVTFYTLSVKPTRMLREVNPVDPRFVLFDRPLLHGDDDDCT
jgi:hypothetical protein